MYLKDLLEVMSLEMLVEKCWDSYRSAELEAESSRF